MRLAVISDIHSNLEALVRVLEQIDREGVEFILNLGDIVGYNASPNECLELLADREVWHLAGNHDLALLDLDMAQHFNIIAYQAIMWAREQVREEYLEFFRSLPLTREEAGFLACHGSPTNPETYITYHFQGKRVFSQLLSRPHLRICFFGHTHRRALWSRDIRGKVGLQGITSPKALLDRECLYLINPGSVGQPRDGNPQAAFAIFDAEEFSIDFRSVPYDVAGAQRRILAAGLPAFLAERLALGV